MLSSIITLILSTEKARTAQVQKIFAARIAEANITDFTPSALNNLRKWFVETVAPIDGFYTTTAGLAAIRTGLDLLVKGIKAQSVSASTTESDTDGSENESEQGETIEAESSDESSSTPTAAVGKYFSFEAVGVKPGSELEFVDGTRVTAAENNKVIFNGETYTLSGFCKKFMPDEKRTASNAYRGCNFFSVVDGLNLGKLFKLAQARAAAAQGESDTDCTNESESDTDCTNESESNTDGTNDNESDTDCTNESESNTDGTNEGESGTDCTNESESNTDGTNESESGTDEDEQSAPKIKHEKYDEILWKLQHGINPYLHGPAGTGKTTVCESLAKDLGLTFYPMSSVTDVFSLIGFVDANGNYNDTPFVNAFRYGGLVLLDEIDNGEAQALKFLNMAIANKYFAVPKFGIIKAHKDFKVVAAGNTIGTGATAEYISANQIDASTLDRFLPIEFGYSEAVEKAITGNDIALVSFVHDLRKAIEAAGLTRPTSYRALINYKQVEGCPYTTFEQNIKDVFGTQLSQDDFGTVAANLTTNNKYTRAFKAVAAQQLEAAI